MTAHAVTIDLEDWHQLMSRRVTGAVGPPSPYSPETVARLLDLLDENAVKATFFVLGMFAETFPEVVREVSRRGHEIGSHSQTHNILHTMSPAKVRAELESSRKLLQDLSGQSVIGFRAPEFSLPSLDHWGFELLAETGFVYDSSIFPGAPRYGVAGAPRRAFSVRTPAGDIQEFPLATWRFGRFDLPVAGGTYFRMIPLAVIERALQAYSEDGATAVLYFHPYEFTRQFLSLAGLKTRWRIRPSYLKYLILHNLGSARIANRLRPLLTRFEFRPLGEIQAQLA